MSRILSIIAIFHQHRKIFNATNLTRRFRHRVSISPGRIAGDSRLKYTDALSIPQILAGLQPLRFLRRHGNNGQGENIAARFYQIHHLFVSGAFDANIVPANRNHTAIAIIPLRAVAYISLARSATWHDTDFNCDCSVLMEFHRLRFSIHSHCSAVM